jgi:lysine biosynthesis protein LysW
MGHCAICGKKPLFKSTVRCKICEKEICRDCALELLHMSFYYKDRRTWYACSEQCWEKFAQIVEGSNPPPKPYKELLRDWMISVAGSPEWKKWLTPKEAYHVARARDDPDFWVDWWVDEKRKYTQSMHRTYPLWQKREEEYNKRKYAADRQVYRDAAQREYPKLAAYAEKVGRFNDAAWYYESLGMVEEARRARDRARGLGLKTEVTVDLNALLQQVKNGGIVVVYKCPSCGGVLKIGKTTGLEQLKVCEHCGAEIEVVSLAEVLRAALS